MTRAALTPAPGDLRSVPGLLDRSIKAAPSAFEMRCHDMSLFHGDKSIAR